MKIGFPKETFPGETRTALTPMSAERLVKKGLTVVCEPGLGTTTRTPDEAYAGVGVRLQGRRELLASCEIVARVRPPDPEEVASLKKGSLHISFLDPFRNRPLIEAFASAGVTALSMEMIPRTTIAQKMDALSSQANLGGYVAVLLAAERLDKIFPMMMTPAGTITPARVFIIGAGVAGLQAIATARRLGARVEAFDTRPVVEEQVKSLGAKFVKVDLGETGQTKDGYAKALTPEQLQRQREAMARVCAQSDVVITTAQLFGRPAPRIITREMISRMAPGSIVVDMAVESGGNVEGSVPDRETEIDGVRVLGLRNLPGRVAVTASRMYASNIAHLVEDLWDAEGKRLDLDFDDEIVRAAVVTHGGTVVNERIQEFYSRQDASQASSGGS